jgi:hypothetical protein
MKVVMGAILEAGIRACFGPGSPTRRRVFPGDTVGTVVAIVTTGPRSLVDSRVFPPPARPRLAGWFVESAPRGLVDFAFFPGAGFRPLGLLLLRESLFP